MKHIFFQCLFLFLCFALIGACEETSEASRNQELVESQESASEFESRSKYSSIFSEGTWISLDVSPDGQVIIFSLLGDLYRVSINGGTAQQITNGSPWDVSPLYSRDGTEIYFISDRSGFKNVWRFDVEDSSIDQVSFSSNHIVGDLEWQGENLFVSLAIVNEVSNSTERILHQLDPSDGSLTRIKVGSVSGNGSPSGRARQTPLNIFSAVEIEHEGFVFSEAVRASNGVLIEGYRLFEGNLKQSGRKMMTARDAPYNEFKPQSSRDGRLLTYFRQKRDRSTELRLRNLRTGADRKVCDLPGSDDVRYTRIDAPRPKYAFLPDASGVVFWHSGHIKIADFTLSECNEIPFEATVNVEIQARQKSPITKLRTPYKATTIRWPNIARNDDIATFSAFGFAWVIDFSTGKIERLSQGDNFEYMPAISQNGEKVAFVSVPQNLDEESKLLIANRLSGEITEIDVPPNSNVLFPRWSFDGRKLAAVVQNTTNDLTFGWFDLESGSFTESFSPPEIDSYTSMFFNSLHVSLDGSSSRLNISYPRSRKEIVLATAQLDGTRVENIVIGQSDIIGIIPSPDLSQLILARADNSIWLRPMDENQGSPITVSTYDPSAKRIGDGAGFFINWQSERRFSFGIGTKVFEYDVHTGELIDHPISLTFNDNNAERVIAFVGARLITMSGETGVGQVLQDGVIIVRNERIEDIGAVGNVSIPSDATVVDVRGKTIVPGFLDTHYHSLAVPSFSGWSLPRDKLNDRSAIAYGVTSAWEPAGPTGDGMAAIADLQSAGRILGPRWSHSAIGSVGAPYEFLTSYSDAVASVQQRIDIGVTTLKEYNAPTREQRIWLADAASVHEVGIVSHIDHFEALMTRLVDGYTGGDHPYLPTPLYEDVVDLLVQSRYIWTPNLVITPGTIGDNSDKHLYFRNALLSEFPDALSKLPSLGERPTMAMSPFETGTPSVPYEDLRVHRVAKAAAQIAAKGGVIGVSSHNRPASGIHEEMWHLWKGGMPIKDILRAATVTNARKIGLHEEVGSLEKGKLADFLILSANPLDNVLNTLSLEFTIQGGVIFDSDTAERVTPEQLAAALD